MNQSMDEIWKRIYVKFSKQGWYAVISAVVFGVFTHLFILTNELFNHDDIGSAFDVGGNRPLRWLQGIFVDFISPWGAPVLTGGLTILLIAISVLLVVDTFQIKSTTYAVIIGAIMVSSPVVACFMSYIEGSYLFVIGLPFAILAFRWYEKGLWGYIGAVLAIVLAIAGYQSLVAVTVACIYIDLFCRLFDDECSIKKWFASFGKAMSILILALVGYIISTKIVSIITQGDSTSALKMGITSSDIAVSGYAAQAETGTLYLSSILDTIIISFKYFIKYHFNIFFGGANVSPASKYCVIANIIVLICVGISVLVSISKKKEWLRKILICATLVVAPICLNSTEIFLNGKAHETMQMMYSIVLTCVFVVCVLEKVKDFNVNIKNLLTNMVCLALYVHIFYNMQITNDAYMRMNSSYETAFAEMNRIIDRVEQLPEWQEGNRKLYFDLGDDIGYLINENYQAFTYYDNYIDMGWLGVMGTGVYKFWHNDNVSNYVKIYFGLEFETPTEEEIQAMKKTDEYQTMEMFPSVNAVKVIDDIVVVKLDDVVVGE